MRNLILQLTGIVAVVISVVACTTPAQVPEKAVPTADTAVRIRPAVECDTSAMDKQPRKAYKQALAEWLSTSSLDWSIRYRQTAWREAKAWNEGTFPIDSNAMLRCLSGREGPLFLYVPHHFYSRTPNGNEFYTFFIANNADDTLLIPCLDDVIANVSSYIADTTASDAATGWSLFQRTDGFVECGNSRWTLQLKPHTYIEAQLECYYIGLGDRPVDYRVAFTLDHRTILSNRIRIELMGQQLPYCGRPVDQGEKRTDTRQKPEVGSDRVAGTSAFRAHPSVNAA